MKQECLRGIYAARRKVALGAWPSATSGWDCQFFAEDALDGHSPGDERFQR
jgi:hypothetical protein